MRYFNSIIFKFIFVSLFVSNISSAESVARLIKAEGRIVLACPNFRSYDAKFFCNFWAAYDVPRHLWHFSKKSISSLFQKHGMVVESIHPMWMDSFYISLLSTRNKYGRYKILQAILVGLISNIKAIFSGQFSSLIFVIRILFFIMRTTLFYIRMLMILIIVIKIC